MTFASIATITLLTLFGAAIVVAAFNAKKLIAWENRVLSSLADSVRDYRETLEEEAGLLERAQSTQPSVRVKVVKPAGKGRLGKAA